LRGAGASQLFADLPVSLEFGVRKGSFLEWFHRLAGRLLKGGNDPVSLKMRLVEGLTTLV